MGVGGRVGQREINGGKTETTVIEQQLKNFNYRKNAFKKRNNYFSQR